MRVPKHTESLLNVDEHRAHTEVALMAILESNGISIRERHEAAWFCRCLRVATEQPQKLEELGNTLCDLIRNGETPEVAHSRLRDIECGISSLRRGAVAAWSGGALWHPKYSEQDEASKAAWKKLYEGKIPLLQDGVQIGTAKPVIPCSNPEQVKANIAAWKAGKTALKLESGACYEDVFPYPANHTVLDANEAKKQLLEENKVLAGYGVTKTLVDNFTAGSLPLEDGEVEIKMDIVSKPGAVQQIHRSGTVAYHGFEIPASELATVASEPPKECICSGHQLFFGECICGAPKRATT